MENIIPTTIFDLVNDVFHIVCSLVSFQDQLRLRATCKEMHPKIKYSGFLRSHFLAKINGIIDKCANLVWFHYSNEDGNGFFRTLPAPYRKCYKLLHCGSTNRCRQLSFVEGCGIENHLRVNILYRKYSIREVIENIGQLMVLELLLEVMDFDRALQMEKEDFTEKDIECMKSYESVAGQDCYFLFCETNDYWNKYNEDMSLIFGHNEGFKAIREMIYGNQKIITWDKIAEIRKLLEIGRKMVTIYDQIFRFLMLS